MQKPFHSWTRLFRQLGWQPRKGRAPLSVNRRYVGLRMEQLAPRHLLTVDVLGGGLVAEFDDGEAVQEVWAGSADSEQALEDPGPVSGGSASQPSQAVSVTSPLPDSGQSPEETGETQDTGEEVEPVADQSNPSMAATVAFDSVSADAAAPASVESVDGASGAENGTRNVPDVLSYFQYYMDHVVGEGENQKLFLPEAIGQFHGLEGRSTFTPDEAVFVRHVSLLLSDPANGSWNWSALLIRFIDWDWHKIGPFFSIPMVSAEVANNAFNYYGLMHGPTPRSPGPAWNVYQVPAGQGQGGPQ